MLDRTADFFTDGHKTRTSRVDNEAEGAPIAQEPMANNDDGGTGDAAAQDLHEGEDDDESEDDNETGTFDPDEDDGNVDEFGDPL